MKKIIWTEDVETIRQEIDLLVHNKTELICGRRGLRNINRYPVVAKTTMKSGVGIFVLFHPQAPSCNSDTCAFYYHRPGNPLRFFECTRVKKAEKYVGYELPRRIYYIHRRKFERVTTPHTSAGTFSLQLKQRIYNGIIDDVSIQGAKILVDMPLELAPGTKLCHVTLTLCLRASERQTVIFVPEAEIIWSNYANSVTTLLGLRFSPDVDYSALLTSYIDLRLIEDASKMGAGTDAEGNQGVQNESGVNRENPFLADEAGEDDIPLF